MSGRVGPNWNLEGLDPEDLGMYMQVWLIQLGSTTWLFATWLAYPPMDMFYYFYCIARLASLAIAGGGCMCVVIERIDKMKIKEESGATNADGMAGCSKQAGHVGPALSLAEQEAALLAE